MASELPRTWDLDSPDAQLLLQELTRELHDEDEALESDPSAYLVTLDRTANELCSASPSSMHELAQTDQESHGPGIAPEEVCCP